jgi:hypothetical protein
MEPQIQFPVLILSVLSLGPIYTLMGQRLLSHIPRHPSEKPRPKDSGKSSDHSGPKCLPCLLPTMCVVSSILFTKRLTWLLRNKACVDVLLICP